MMMTDPPMILPGVIFIVIFVAKGEVGFEIFCHSMCLYDSKKQKKG